MESIKLTDIVTRDESGQEETREVFLRYGQEWIVDFGWPSSYYLRALLDPTARNEKGLCIYDGDPSVWVDRDTFFNVLEEALYKILVILKKGEDE